MKKLSEDELESISGGVTERADGGTKGMEIVCPVCGANKDSDFSDTVYQDVNGSLEYHCKACKTDFVCYKGSVALKQEWIELCNEKKHYYPFQ